MTEEMKKILDEYFQGKESVSGFYPEPYAGYPTEHLRATVERKDVERQLESGELAKRDSVADAIKQLREHGKVTSNYFPWIIQLAKELVKKEDVKC